MAKIYQTGQEAQQSLLHGVRKLGTYVTTTLGPKGRNVALNRKWLAPAVIHDGVTIAKDIELADPFENMGAQLVKEAASKTVDKAGDGTTTSTLLAWKLIEKGFRYVDEGHNPMMMKEGIEKAIDLIVEELGKKATPVKEGDIEKVATISAANADVGKVIAETMEKVGIDGVITVEDGMGEDTIVEYKEGMMFDKGYGSPYFVTNQDELYAEIFDPLILYTDMVIDSQQDLTDFLDKVLKENRRNIVIIAHEFQGMTLPILIQNHQKGIIRCLTVKAPSFGLKRVWMLEDMAALTGGTVITRQSGRTLTSVTMEELGHAEKVWSDKDFTKIIGGKGDKKVITERIAAIKKQIQTEKSEFEKKGLRDRIARLAGGAAIIYAGARTETELKDKKERIEDAVQATKSAVAEGIIAGGGIALSQCQDSLRHLIEEEQDPDIRKGIELIQSILSEPLRKILQNAGKTPEIIIEHIQEYKEDNFEMGLKGWANSGYDVVKNEYGDMLEMGIIDPVKVTRQALQHAGSVAGMILTIDVLSTDPEENAKEEIPPMT